MNLRLPIHSIKDQIRKEYTMIILLKEVVASLIEIIYLSILLLYKHLDSKCHESTLLKKLIDNAYRKGWCASISKEFKICANVFKPSFS